jgi:extradiol dioxygenase family protein
MKARFHLSLPIEELIETRRFYEQTLGFEIGRFGPKWFDVNMYGTQLTFVQLRGFQINNQNYSFDGNMLPAFHFGLVLDKAEWIKQLEILKCSDCFLHDPIVFMKNIKGQHRSFFVKDPNNYIIEYKYFEKTSEIFERQPN